MTQGDSQEQLGIQCLQAQSTEPAEMTVSLPPH